MEGSARPIWFAGDLDDPWVLAIAEALPRDSLWLHCPGDLPESWPIDRPNPFSVVLHRSNLTSTDAQWLVRLKARADRTPRIVLCVGPHARYSEVERWSRLVDIVIPESTARETIARHALALDRKLIRPGGLRPRVLVVSTNYELRSTLAEAARSGGFAAEAISELANIPPGIPVVWDVPVLELDWPDRLGRLARLSPLVALLGFADRPMVTLARRYGASACLNLPCEVGDLLAALDRIATARLDLAHDVPPQPKGIRTVLDRATVPPTN